MSIHGLCQCVHGCLCAVGEALVSMESFPCRTKLLNCRSSLMQIEFYSQEVWFGILLHSLFRRESHYGENDGDGDGDVHGLKRHREQSVTPYNSNTKRKWRTSYFVDLPSLHFTASRRFPERRNHRRSRIHSELPLQSAQEPCSTVEVVISANMAVIFLSASESHFAFDLLAAAAIAHFFVR